MTESQDVHDLPRPATEQYRHTPLKVMYMNGIDTIQISVMCDVISH